MGGKRREYLRELRGENPGVRIVESDDPLERHAAIEAELARKRLIIGVSVIAVMAVVVTLWVMTLPLQMARLRHNLPQSAFLPDVQSTKDDFMAKWAETMNGAQDNIVKMSGDLGLEEVPFGTSTFASDATIPASVAAVPATSAGLTDAFLDLTESFLLNLEASLAGIAAPVESTPPATGSAH